MKKALLLVALLAASAGAAELPRYEQVRAQYRPSDSVLLDRHGEPIHTLRTDASVRRLDWVPLAEVSPALRTALVLSEDKRFYEHSGVDWPAVGAAAFGNLWNSRTRGASTLTMQLAGLLDADAASRAGGRSFAAKLAQAGGAWELERHWRKDQILEAYLNLVPFRGELVGIGALSATLFAKHPSGLDAQEAALAAALLRAPNAPASNVSQRACGILQSQRLGCEGLEGLAALALARKSAMRLEPDAQIAPHVAQRLLPGDKRPRVPSTLDARLQRVARDALRQQLAELSGRQVEDGAVMVIDNATGEVLAWVGSSGADWSRAPQVDGVLARRQAGSTLKPFLYELALEQRWLTAASLLDDSPLGLETLGGLYIPENYDHGFKGPVSVRTALASSLNVPAVRTLVAVSPEAFHQRLQALGFDLRASGGTYGYSLALGSAEVTLAALTNAYRSLANGGRTGPWRLQPAGPRPTSTTAAMDAAASYIVADILADREARALTFGLDNALAARRWAAVKTGTSKDMRDNWCVGFTRRYTVGVWVGNASGQPMADVSGTSGAAPVWRGVVDELMRREEGAGAAARTAKSSPPPPPGLVRQAVRYEAAMEPPRAEWFLAGTEQARLQRAIAAPSTKLIAAPIDGTVLALDPDIPPAAQRLRIAAARPLPAGWRWRLDKRVLGPATPRHVLPWPGLHRLDLVDENGSVRETLSFEVRGARTRGADRRMARAGQAPPGLLAD
ncbi:penicillin-binding protein 1C [Ideonella sp. YS5]|uniref:penicillin-binding protein 1C n=1 Tax=Ideonella sp. YS5 TaxID=3453714 RepID=UPI003EEF3703